MIARLLGHPRWRAKTRAGELLEAFGLAEAAGRSGRTRAVCADGWPSRLMSKHETARLRGPFRS